MVGDLSNARQLAKTPKRPPHLLTQNQIWASCSDIDIISDVTPKPVNECGGVFGNNEGGRDPPPVAAGSACKCSALCQV